MNGSETVRVSWQAVEDVDNYTVSFSAAVGDGQEGLCTDDYHSASVTVNVSTASIDVGEDVDSNETSLLRAYTTYSVTVVAFSNVWGTAEGKQNFTTLQTSIHIDAIADESLIFPPLSDCVGAVVPPSNVSATVMSSTSISVEWEGIIPCTLVNGLIVKYRIQYRTQNGEVEITEQSGTWNSSSALLISGLVSSTTYFFQVAAVNEKGDVGLYSDPIAAETRPL